MTRLARKLVRLTHSKHNGEDIVDRTARHRLVPPHQGQPR